MIKTTLLVVCVLLTACQEQQRPPQDLVSRPETIKAGLKLAGRIVSTPARPPAIVLSLQNLSTKTIAVQTGGSLNGKLYPAASFHFLLLWQDGSETELDCTSCAPAAIIGGSPGPPYKVFLNPSERQSISVPVTALVYFRGSTAHTLCLGTDKGRLLRISLQGVYSEPASWTGSATVAVQLP
jgi:hypothetical protein